MRLLVVSNLFHPDRGGGASVFSDLCFGLAERGWEVTVLTTHPYYPEWRRKSGASFWRVDREEMHGVRVYRHWIHVPGRPSALVPRVLFELSFGISLLRSLVRGPRQDAVMVFCPLLGAVAFSVIRKWIRRETLWLNIQDIPADAATASGISRSRLFDGLAQGLQRFLFNRADEWSSISPVMCSRLARLRRDGREVQLHPNWLNRSLAQAIADAGVKRRGAPGAPPRLLYAGNIGKKQGLVDVLEELAGSPLAFELTVHGDGGEAEAVRTWIAGRGDARFRFGPFLDEAGFVRALHAADLFLISERSGAGASFIPSKLIPCISTGTPVLAVCDGEGPLGTEVREHGLGLIVPWSSLGRFREEVGAFLADPARMKECEARCLARSRYYQRDNAIDRLAEAIRRAAAG